MPNFEQFYWDPPVAMPWPDGPTLISTEHVVITDGMINLFFEDFSEGEVYIIDITPSSCCLGIRGNANNDPDDKTNVADVSYLVAWLFGIPSGTERVCIEEANANGDVGEAANISDVSYLVAWLFGIPSGPAPGACP